MWWVEQPQIHLTECWVGGSYPNPIKAHKKSVKPRASDSLILAIGSAVVGPLAEARTKTLFAVFKLTQPGRWGTLTVSGRAVSSVTTRCNLVGVSSVGVKGLCSKLHVYRSRRSKVTTAIKRQDFSFLWPHCVPPSQTPTETRFAVWESEFQDSGLGLIPTLTGIFQS